MGMQVAMILDLCVCSRSGEGDEFSAGEEEGDLEEGGGDEEEMVEFITNGEDSLHALSLL